jgi:hypothetical protein
MNSIAEQLLKDMPNQRHPWELSKWAKLWACSNVDRGLFGENWIAKYLEQKGYKAVKAPSTCDKEDKGCDLLVNDDIRVEVKLGFAAIQKRTKKTVQRRLLLDASSWYHLEEGTADVYALIGINPDEDMEYHVRPGWRTDHEDSYLIFITEKIFKEWGEKNILTRVYDQWMTSSSTMKKIDYGYDFREFPIQ